MAVTPITGSITPFSKVFMVTDDALAQDIDRPTLLAWFDEVPGPLREFLYRTADWTNNANHIRLTRTYGGYEDNDLRWAADTASFVWSATKLTVTLIAPAQGSARMMHEMRYLYSNER